MNKKPDISHFLNVTFRLPGRVALALEADLGRAMAEHEKQADTIRRKLENER